MNRFIPDMYVKSILDINYNKLKGKGIKVLLFDFDNTIIAHKVNILEKEYIVLMNNLQKDFFVYIISNSFNTKKLSKISSELKLSYIGASLKPFGFGYKRLKISHKPHEIAMIGDQIITDVWGAKRQGYYSVLIDPINKKNEIIFTKINRKIEEKVIEKLNKLKRGNYYD